MSRIGRGKQRRLSLVRATGAVVGTLAASLAWAGAPVVDAGPSGDIDADLRVALLAIWGSGDSRLAAEFLRESADRKKALQAAAGPSGDTSTVPPLARWYVEMRAGAAKALLTAECSVIRAMADTLPRKLAGKATRSSSTG